MPAPKSVVRLARNVSTASVASRRVATGDFSGNSPEIDPKTASERANRLFNQNIVSSRIELSHKVVENTIRLNINAGKFDHNVAIASAIKADPLGKRFLSPRLYVLLLELLAAENVRKYVPLALQLFKELAGGGGSREDLELASVSLFKCFENCGDFTQLLGLNIVYHSIVARHIPSKSAMAMYLACHLHVLLNSGQLTLAVRHFRRCLEQLNDDTDLRMVLETLPMKKLLQELSLAQDCDSMLEVLGHLVANECTKVLTCSDWSEILSLALWKNHFHLVKLIYTHVIMAGIDFHEFEHTVSHGATATNPLLSSLSENALHQILHTLASNGDVSLCLELIEWHYIHKPLAGEKALTKALCVDIIRAYCYHKPESMDTTKQDMEDSSVKTVLDVIESFVAKRRHLFEYKDIVGAFLHKLNTLQIMDENVASAMAANKHALSNATRNDPLTEAQDAVLLTKKSNTNIHESALGSVLKNTETLQSFVAGHFKYIQEKEYSAMTLQIFVNCLLSHLATYQNTSAILLALQTMKALDNQFTEKWLDKALYDIIIHSFAESPAAMATGLAFYRHMKARGKQISSTNFKKFVFSSLRGTNYNLLLEYYVSEYLKLDPETVSKHLIGRLRSFKRINDQARCLLQVLEKYNHNEGHEIGQMWTLHGFTSSDPQILPLPEEPAAYHLIDQRDRAILEKILA